MENSKRSAKEALNGAASSRQCLRHQEGATHDPLTTSGHRADSVQPSGFSSSTARHQLPCYLRRRIDNDDLLASINRHGQNLADYLSLAESALAMVRCRSPPKADSVEDRLAKAEARITSEISIITFVSSQFYLQDPDHLPFESFRFVSSAGKPLIGYGVRGGIRQRQRCRPGGSPA